jgi:hypothetical protein
VKQRQNYSAICARCKQGDADQRKTDEFERQRMDVDSRLDQFFFPGSPANGTFASCNDRLKTDGQQFELTGLLEDFPGLVGDLVLLAGYLNRTTQD